MLLLTDGKSFRVEPLTFFRTWQLHWREETNKHGWTFTVDVHMKFETKDFNDPVINISCKSKEEGERLSARLSLVING